MLLQFTTGSVEDRQRYDIQITILNAGIQPANVVCTLTKFRGETLESVTEHVAKVAPQDERVILDETGLNDVHCDVTIKVDSPSLIITIKGETRYPLHCQTVFVEDVSAPKDDSRPAPRTVSLFWGYASKGDPF